MQIRDSLAELPRQVPELMGGQRLNHGRSVTGHINLQRLPEDRLKETSHQDVIYIYSRCDAGGGRGRGFLETCAGISQMACG